MTVEPFLEVSLEASESRERGAPFIGPNTNSPATSSQNPFSECRYSDKVAVAGRKLRVPCRVL